MEDVLFRTLAELEAAADEIGQSPTDDGILELIVRRPKTNMREVLNQAELTLEHGLVGDKWKPQRTGTESNDCGQLDNQLTLMNSRVIALIARDKDRWPLAGDQLYVDMDLSLTNLPPGMRLALGSAVIEITELPHTGCRKFTDRFGSDAMKFVNSPAGRQLQLRGVHAKVIQAGVVAVGDVVRKIQLSS